MSRSSCKHCDDSSTVRLHPAGDLRGPSAAALQAEIVHTIAHEQPDRLIVALDAVTELDITGVTALMAGYLAAINHGVSYQVTGAHGQPRKVLSTTGTLDVLTDTDNLGALLLALALRPARNNPRCQP